MNNILAITEHDVPCASWMNELEKRLLTSLRSLKVENHGLRSEVKRLQRCLGQGVRDTASSNRLELEAQLQLTQLKTRENCQEVQWLLKQSQEVLEIRLQELQRLRREFGGG